ncbi:hypothetical protein R1sor_006129 [Riccia sorocarpa]|uniref:Uncharacterized protein n=1 Tax=Riccia sorocarpa TaxID=122646 RepID=A0ABD3HLI9_9MARC
MDHYGGRSLADHIPIRTTLVLQAETRRSEANICVLKLETGEVISDDDRIAELVEDNYKNLYSADPETEEVERTRREALQLIDKRLKPEQNEQLDAMPTEELIEEVVLSLSKDKAPGIDGVTVEVLIAGWSFVRTDCFAMTPQKIRAGGVRSPKQALGNAKPDTGWVNFELWAKVVF